MSWTFWPGGRQPFGWELPDLAVLHLIGQRGQLLVRRLAEHDVDAEAGAVGQ
ncbi:MAG: hypothetical protein M3Q39_02740 [Actinomycetota bacterium]|nr:hypothetical protein [Actinomycetota bacterium]